MLSIFYESDVITPSEMILKLDYISWINEA